MHIKSLAAGIILLCLIGLFGVYAYLENSDRHSVSLVTDRDEAALLNTHDLSASLKTVDATLEIDPTKTRALVAKAKLLAQIGSTTYVEQPFALRALEAVDAALALDPNDVEAWYVKGFAYEIQQDYQAALEAYDQALELEPTHSASLSQKAHVYDLTGDLDVAGRLYQRALRSNPHNEKAYLGLGRIALLRGDAEQAFGYFSLVAENAKNPRTAAEAAYSAGGAALAMNDLTAAERFARQAIARDPRYDAGWTGLAQILYQRSITEPRLSGDDRQALASETLTALSTSIALNPKQSQAYYTLGMVLITMRQLEDGRRALQRAHLLVADDITLSRLQKQQATTVIDAALSEAAKL